MLLGKMPPIWGQAHRKRSGLPSQPLHIKRRQAAANKGEILLLVVFLLKNNKKLLHFDNMSAILSATRVKGGLPGLPAGGKGYVE